MSAFNLLRPLLLGSVALAVMAPVAHAQSTTRNYNVEAQSAQSGLQALGSQSGLQVIAPQADLVDKRINAVKGRMEARVALRTAIAGSGLEIVSDNGSTVVLRAAAKAPATAPSAASAAADPIEEVIVVASPIQYSLRKSIVAQRNATNVVNVIASDTIGRFPDQTAAAALSRLPGVAVQRDQGQERYVQVRGAPARWSSVAFNGVAILGAEDRVFRFDSVPSALIGQLSLNKTLDASMPAESLAGYVDIQTYSALANPGFHGQADLGTGFVDLGDGPQTSYSGRVSWANDKIGLVLAGSHFAFEQQTDNAEPRYDATGVSQLRAAKYVIQRETNSLSAAIEYRPAPGHKLSFTSLYNEFIDDEERNQYTFYFNGGTGTRNFQTASLTGVEVRGLFNKGGQETSVLYNVAHGEHEIGGWVLDRDIGHHKSVLQSGSPLIEQFQNAPLRPGVNFVLGEGNIPVLTLFDPVAQGGGQRTSLDQMAFNQERITWSGSKRETTDKIAQIDVTRDWASFGANAKFKAGAQFNDRRFTDVGSYSNVTPAGGTGIFDARAVSAALGVAWNPNSFVQINPVDEDFNRGFTFNYVDNAAMRARSEALIAAARQANANGGTYAVPQLSPTQHAEIEEKLTSAYAMNTWQWQNQMLQVGLRAEKVETTSTGTATINGATQPIVLNNDSTKVFPSVHWNMDVTPDVKVRAAYVRGSARPSFGSMSSSVTINDANTTVSGGNTALEAETAQGFDGSVEWYPAASSVVSANVFYRKVSDVLFASTTTVGDDRYNASGIDRSAYRYSTTVNGDDGKFYGLELAYSQPWRFLPGAFSGLGMEASLTFLEGEFTTPAGRETAFPGTSDRVTNVSFFYEKYKVSARLSYQHRSKWLDEVGASAAADMWWDPSERLDFSGRYYVRDNLSVYVDANNLTDELGRRYQGPKDRTYELEGFGRRFMVGVRANF